VVIVVFGGIGFGVVGVLVVGGRVDFGCCRGVGGVVGVIRMSVVNVASGFVGVLAGAAGGDELIAELLAVGDGGVVFDGDAPVHGLEGDGKHAGKFGGAVFEAAGTVGREEPGQRV
jgi:hypothetical protein